MWCAVSEPTLAELQAQLETVAAERAELQLRIKRRELVEVARLEPGIAALGHRVRDLLMFMMPARVGATLAADHRVEAALLSATLMAMMRRMLTDISKGYQPPTKGA